MYFSNEDISKLIASEFSSYPTHINRIEMGVMNFNYQFRINDNNYILRIYPETASTRASSEFEILLNCYENGCKVPKPIKSNNLGRRFLIYEMLPGQALSLEDKKLNQPIYNRLITGIAKNIYCLSKITFHNYGSLTLDEGKFDSWTDFLKYTIDTGHSQLIQSSILDRVSIDIITDFLLKECRLINLRKACLVWSDFSKENIIVNDGKLSGFIDFEGSISGDPVLSLGYLYAIEGDSKFYKAILNSIKQYFDVSEKRVFFYAMIRLYRLSKYLSQPLPTGIRRSSPFEFFKGLPNIVTNFKKGINY